MFGSTIFFSRTTWGGVPTYLIIIDRKTDGTVHVWSLAYQGEITRVLSHAARSKEKLHEGKQTDPWSGVSSTQVQSEVTHKEYRELQLPYNRKTRGAFYRSSTRATTEQLACQSHMSQSAAQHSSQLRRPVCRPPTIWEGSPNKMGAKGGGSNLTNMSLETTTSLQAEDNTSWGTSGCREPPSGSTIVCFLPLEKRNHP